MSLFRRNPQRGTIEALYGAIVAQSRAPVFYRDYGVPDTVNGRLDLLMLHLSLVFERLSQGDAVTKEAGQAAVDRFCRDMDDHLREQGFADTKVPKEVRGVAAAFLGRHRAYISALRAGDDVALTEALRRNVYQDAQHDDVSRLAGYLHRAMTVLDGQDRATVAAGDIGWPDPQQVEKKQTER